MKTAYTFLQGVLNGGEGLYLKQLIPVTGIQRRFETSCNSSDQTTSRLWCTRKQKTLWYPGNTKQRKEKRKLQKITQITKKTYKKLHKLIYDF